MLQAQADATMQCRSVSSDKEGMRRGGCQARIPRDSRKLLFQVDIKIIPMLAQHVNKVRAVNQSNRLVFDKLP